MSRLSRIVPFALLLSGVPAGVTAAEPDAPAQVAALDRIAWLAGRWEGSATTQVRDGEARSISSETVRRAAGGTALLIQGRHWRVTTYGARGDVVHDTAGLVTYDPASGKYQGDAP